MRRERRKRRKGRRRRNRRKRSERSENDTPQLPHARKGPRDPSGRLGLRTTPYIGDLWQVGGETKHETVRKCRTLIEPSV